MHSNWIYLEQKLKAWLDEQPARFHNCETNVILVSSILSLKCCCSHQHKLFQGQARSLDQLNLQQLLQRNHRRLQFIHDFFATPRSAILDPRHFDNQNKNDLGIGTNLFL